MIPKYLKYTIGLKVFKFEISNGHPGDCFVNYIWTQSYYKVSLTFVIQIGKD